MIQHTKIDVKDINRFKVNNHMTLSLLILTDTENN